MDLGTRTKVYSNVLFRIEIGEDTTIGRTILRVTLIVKTTVFRIPRS